MFQLDFQVNGNVDQQIVFFHKTCEIQEVPKSGKVWKSQSACLFTPSVLSAWQKVLAWGRGPCQGQEGALFL